MNNKPSVPSASGRSNKHKSSQKLWGVLSFVHRPALDSSAIDYFASESDENCVSTKTILGKNSAKPMELEIPLLIADMSFGALSETAKLALAKGSAIAGIASSTGEGGVLPREKEYAKNLVIQYSTGRFGWPKKEDFGNNEEFDTACAKYVEGCSAICLKFGQGAKPGQGGLLPSHKVTSRIAEIRNIPEGESCHSPASHSDIKTEEDLKKKADWLKKISDGAPLIIKFGAGHIEKDVDLAVKVGADIIEIDGSEGGTGAAPAIMLHEVGIPTLVAVIRARNYLNKLKEGGNNKLPSLIIGGGIKNGAEVAKCLAFGADAVMMGFGFMKAMGCIECGVCYKGQCPKGIATQDPELEKKLDLKKASNDVANFAKTIGEEMKMLSAVCGKVNAKDLNKEDMRCELDPLGKLVSEITGVKMAHEPDSF